MGRDRQRWSRRGVLGLAVAGGAGLLLGCTGERAGRAGSGETAAEPTTGAGATAAAFAPDVPPATPATPAPVPPEGRAVRALLAGTASETELVVAHSGVAGPVLMVLGGVHGNEPGGWLAADEVGTWRPAAGSLVVLARANTQAIGGFVRTYEEIGDLNRLYPGNAESQLLMERMAAAIVSLARELRVDVVLDLHESWAFYATRARTAPPSSGRR